METKRVDLRLTVDEAEAVRNEAATSGQSMNDVIRDSLKHFHTTPRPTYSLDGGPTPSLIRDVWLRAHPSEVGAREARDRLASHTRFMTELSAQFATATTSTDPEIIPPGYRPLLASSESDRPLFAAASKGDVKDATSFLVPANITETAIGTGAAAHVEGTNPTEGTMNFAGVTVSPAGISGTFRVTRELVDSTNPAIDAIAMGAMREDWARQAEATIFAELNGSNGQGGTITGDTVPSGAMARTSAGAALPADLRKALLLFAEYRKVRPRSVVASTRKSVSEALETLDMSTAPAGGEDIAVVAGCGVRLSPWITGTAAGDGDVFVLGSGDLWCWSSPLLEFSYYERQGPALVDLALYGYFGTRLVKPAGLASIRHT